MDGKFTLRVQQALADLLEREGLVSPVDLLLRMQMLHQCHVDNWRRAHPMFPDLESSIQCGPKKLNRMFEMFLDFVKRDRLVPFTVEYELQSRRETRPLKILKDPDEQREAFFRTAYRRSDLPEAKQKKIEAKKNKPTELAVFELVTDSGKCLECELELTVGTRIVLERQQPLCLSCADMEHLEFLPAGDATLTRRAKKFSPLSAVLLRFNRRRKRYDRLGILVTPQAIAAAEDSCENDADVREKQRARAAVRRESLDQQLVADYVAAIHVAFPNCPQEEAQAIAEHTAVRGSGRVGRSAAGRAVDEKAVRLSVIAWIRHQHTPYDELLMQGTERMEAREQIAKQLTRVLAAWSG